MERSREHFKITRHQSHCSRHATGMDLLEIVKNIAPKSFFPIHTEHPEIYQKSVKNIILIKEGSKYSL